MLAFAIDDAVFGFLYVALVAVLTAGLVFGFGMPLRWMQGVVLLGVLASGFLIGIAVSGAYADISGTAPPEIARPLQVAPVLTQTHPPPPKVAPADGEISVDIFQSGPSTQRAPAQLTIKAGDPVRVEGWAYDVAENMPCGAVDVAIDGRSMGRLTYGIPRTDVGAFYKDTEHLPTGFGGTVSTKGLQPGEHQVRVRCINPSSNVAYPGLQQHELRVIK